MKKVKVECMQEKKVGFEREKDRDRERVIITARVSA
jgi:hypothetical protein